MRIGGYLDTRTCWFHGRARHGASGGSWDGDSTILLDRLLTVLWETREDQLEFRRTTAAMSFVSLPGKGFPTVAALIAAPAALILTPGRAEAILTYNIIESGPDVIIQATGSLTIPLTPSGTLFGQSGINPDTAKIFSCNKFFSSIPCLPNHWHILFR